MAFLIKNNVLATALPIVLVLDLLIPFLLAPSYHGYNHLIQVMSVLGNDKAPLHLLYNIWLIILGIVLMLNTILIYSIIIKHSTILAVLLCIALLIYAIGGCILSGFFSVGENKNLVTIPQKIHGYGSVIGFMLLSLTPLLLSMYGIKADRIAFAICSFACFLLAITFFTLFIMADKPSFQSTWIAYEGLWQRLSLLFMYIPIACIHII